MKQQIPTPIQRVGYSSLITSNTTIPQTDFRQEIRVYKAEQADLAPQKGLYVNERYQLLKVKESQALLSVEGSRIFAQRKVDVEPVFGQTKACLGYKRCNLRGK